MDYFESPRFALRIAGPSKIQIDYRQTVFSVGELLSNYRYRIALPEESISMTETDLGKKYTPKVFSALKTQLPQQAKKGGLVDTKRLVFKGKKKGNTYTPKSLQGPCGGPLRAALVYRFWPPKTDLWEFQRKISRYRYRFSLEFQ